MNAKHFSIILCFLCIGLHLSAQTDSERQDSTKVPGFYEYADTVKDSIGPVRSYPTGDTFGDPIVVNSLSISAPLTYSNTVNTNDYSNAYVGQCTKDVYYVFQLSKEMVVTLTHNGSNIEDTYIHLLGSAIQLIAENDDYSGDGHCYYTTQAYLKMVLPAGTYFVVSEGKTYDGYITTNITIEDVPTGNTFDDPIIAGSFSSSFTYQDTRDTRSYGNHTGHETGDVYYRFTLTAEMNVTITNDGSSIQDTYLYLLNSSGSIITYNDNYFGDGHCANTNQAFIRWQLTPGTYYVVAEGFSENGSVTTNITANTEAGFGYPSIPSTYSTQPGNAVGSMGGAFSVSPMGGATYSIPIEVPQGVGGLQPQLAIVYNSQAGNGLCGYGASLSGLSSITRGPKDIYHDTIAQGMKYLAGDALYLDGVRLILSSGTAGQEGAVYNPESDPFTRVITHGTCTSTSNNIWFEVQSSDGMIYRYGYNPDSNTETHSKLSFTANGAQKIHSWYLSYVLQPTGNFMTYTYLIENNCVYPSTISYGKNENQGNGNNLNNLIEFSYDNNRADSIPVVFDGKRGSMKRRLHTITGKTNNNIYRTYTLNYNTTGDGTASKFSRLVDVTKSNAQNLQLPATQFGWSFLPSVSCLSYSFPINESLSLSPYTTIDTDKMMYETGDLNGDGIADVILIAPAETDNGDTQTLFTIVNIYYSSVSPTGEISFSSEEDYYNIGFLGSFACTTIGMKGRIVLDIDGDGINELLIPIYKETDGSISSRIRFYLIGQNYDREYLQIIASANIDPLFSSLDVDNDGKAEVLYLETIQTSSAYRLFIMHYNDQYTSGEGNIFQSVAQYNLALSYNPKNILTNDWNGDGLEDLMVITDHDYTIYWNQCSETSSTYFSDTNKTVGSGLKYHKMTTLGDFNGDGLMDLLTNESGTTNWYFHLNNGNGVFTQEMACSLNVTEQYFTDRDNDKFHCDIIDFDGDGKQDVIVTKAMYEHHTDISGGWGTFLKTHTYWMHSTGTTLEQVYHATSNRADDALSNKYITGDFDGDGRTELVNYGYDCAHGNNSNTNPVWRIYKNSNLTLQSGKVTSITGDMGATTSITYSTLAIPDVYTKGTADVYPAPKYTIPLNVVRQTIQSNGAAGNMTTTYSYSGLKVHLQGKGILGFTSTTANNSTLGTSTTSSVEAWNSTFHIPSSTKVRTTIEDDYSETTTTLNITGKGHKKYFAYPIQTVARDFDGNSCITICNFDTINGYILSDSTVYGTNMYRSTAYYSYTMAGGAYRPQTVISRQRHPDDTAPFCNTTTYSYNVTTGALATKVENYGSSKPLTTSYTYDLWGNLTSQVRSGSGVTACTTYYRYDGTHRFPLRIYTNPSSSVHKCTYDLWGNVLTEQDSINASITNTVTNTYDGWGNLVRTEIPGGGEVTYTRGWNNEAGKRYFILTQGTARPWVKTWYDNQGREVCTESIGPNNVNVISTITYSYDNNHELTVSSTDVNGDLSLTTSKKYDARGRIKNESYPGGADWSYTYSTPNGVKTVTIDNNNRTTTCTYDLWGNLKSLKGPLSDSISHKYYSNGGIKETTSNGATWTFGYDQRGNRTSMTDPDAGTTTYVYDALGRERSRTDARNIANVTNYDYLGRVTSAASVTYTYGTNGTDQMRLKSKSYGGWTETYEYDAYGNVTHETMSNGTDITRHRYYTYNANGQLTDRTLPGNMTYGYTYDAYGNLTGVNGAGGAVQWSLADYTGRRTVSNTVLNGYSSYQFSTTHLLDQYGQLDSIKTSQNSGYYQLDDYNFYPITGNLISANNHMTDGETWTFVYDIADRLTKVRENNQDIMEMTYAANGNITSKTGIGSYIYNHSKPHAVDTVSNTLGKLPGGDMYVSYNNWGKMSSVWYNGPADFYSYSVIYGPDMQRVTSEMHKTYQKQYEKFYWDDYEEKVMGTDTLHYYYVYGADGLAGLHIVKTGPNIQTTTHTTKVITDHLGSIISLIDNSDWAYDVQYDVWGNREVMLTYDFDPTFDRGYTGHEHIDVLNLINMNGRMYDPQLGRFLSPDPFIQSPTDPQNFNRYSYCLNNPLKYTDPDGESIVGAMIIGAIIGAYSGGVLANDGQFNPGKWDWESNKTWGYMAGGLLTGALSGAAGAAIATSGIPMANTLSIMGGSLTNSLGTYAYTGGQTDITMSFGFCSYNFTQDSWGWLGKDGNSTMENIGYVFGAFSNLNDINNLFDKTMANLYTQTEDHGHFDKISHSAIVSKYKEIMMSYGPNGDYKDKWSGFLLTPRRSTAEYNPHISESSLVSKNMFLNKYLFSALRKISEHIPYQGMTSNCVNWSSIGLWLNGIPNIGIHPFLLHASIAIYNTGVYNILATQPIPF